MRCHTTYVPFRFSRGVIHSMRFDRFERTRETAKAREKGGEREREGESKKAVERGRRGKRSSSRAYQRYLDNNNECASLPILRLCGSNSLVPSLVLTLFSIESNTHTLTHTRIQTHSRTRTYIPIDMHEKIRVRALYQLSTELNQQTTTTTMTKKEKKRITTMHTIQ